MAYEWDPGLATGYITIDNQHMQLFSILNNLIDASNEGKGDAIVFNVLRYLTGYTVSHFQLEEDLMIKYEYKEFFKHKKLHDEFKEKVGELTKRLTDEGATKEMIDLVTKTIRDWLVNHIKYVDFLMADFVKDKEKKK